MTRCERLLSPWGIMLAMLVAGLGVAAEDPDKPGAIEPGDTVAARSPMPLQDEDETLLTLSEGEQVFVEGVLGDWVLLVAERNGKRTRGWGLVENLTVVKRRNATTKPFSDAEGRVYYCVRLDKVKMDVDEKDRSALNKQPKKGAVSPAFYPRAFLDGAGEAYIAFASSEWKPDNAIQTAWLAIRAPRGQSVTGSLEWPKPDGSGSVRVRFRLGPEQADLVGARMFFWGQMSHYLALARCGPPGAAWFRYQAGGTAGNTSRQRPAPGRSESEVLDTPLLHFAEPRSENGHLMERYERQLGLRIMEMEEIAGTHGVRSLALTGSDPFFSLGTDVALLFESSKPEALEQALWSKITQAGKKHPEAVQGREEGAGFVCRAVVSPDRSISSYLVRWDDVVMVANSPCQVQRWADLRENRCSPIASLPEYRFFRSRYRLGAAEETALVLLSDATIRRWCSPTWRIADSRRIRAAAAMADLQAANLEAIVSGRVKPGSLEPGTLSTDLGTVTLSRSGITSSIYGTLRFMTPVAEMNLSEVSQAEAEAYVRWRTAFERDWRIAFDPVAIRAEVTGDRLSADLTVMPLIANTEYRTLVSLVQDANIEPQAGDRHATLLHGIAAVNRGSELVKLIEGFVLSSWEPKATLQWLGPTAELYFEPDPFWKELASLAARQDEASDEEARKVISETLSRVPIAARLAVSDRPQARAFLDAARQRWKKSEGDNVSFEELTYRDQAYSCAVIRPTGGIIVRKGVFWPSWLGVNSAGPGKPQMGGHVMRNWLIWCVVLLAIAGTACSKGSFKGPKNPVDGAGWNDCQAFIAKLNEKFRAERAKFALPTEAQWEYACRAGTTTRWSFGDDPAKLDDYAWSEKNGKETTHPVGQKKPNAWGLYDMHGNVCEWCADWYVKDYYAKCPAEDPAGPSSGAARVLRGGAWYCGHDNARSAVRYRFTPGLRYLNVGFRAARTP